MQSVIFGFFKDKSCGYFHVVIDHIEFDKPANIILSQIHGFCCNDDQKIMPFNNVKCMKYINCENEYNNINLHTNFEIILLNSESEIIYKKRRKQHHSWNIEILNDAQITKCNENMWTDH